LNLVACTRRLVAAASAGTRSLAIVNKAQLPGLKHPVDLALKVKGFHSSPANGPPEDGNPDKDQNHECGADGSDGHATAF
jgi:hypothetical protein